MIINRSGLTIRTSADQIRVAGRATQGVKVIDLREGDAIASVTAVPKTDDDIETEGAAVEGATAEGEVTATEGAQVAETVENSNE